MAFSVIQAVKVSVGSATTATTATITTQTTGSQFVVFVQHANNRTVSSSTGVTDNKGNTYTARANQADASIFQTTGVWVATNATPAGGAGHTFTVTLVGGTDFPTVIAWECSGLDVTVDAGGTTSVSHTTATTTTTNSPSITSLTAADVILGFGGNSGDANSPSQAINANTGGGTYTIPTNSNQTTVVGYPSIAGYQAVAATAAYSVTYSIGVSEGNASVGVLALKQGASAAARQQTFALLGVGV